MSKNVKIGLIQMSMVEDANQNLARAAELAEQAAQQGAQVIALPELFTTPYFARVEKVARDYTEKIPGPSTQFLSELAKRLGVVLVAGSIYEDAGDKKFNTAMVFEKTGELLGIYRKTHIPHDPGFYECNYFAPGDTGFKVFNTSIGKIGVLICYDQWFPEAARATALLGADMIFYPTAIGTVKGLQQEEGNWQEAWENVQRGHAIANGTIVAGINRVGMEGDSTFWGGSFICNAFGKTLVRGGVSEEVVVATVDLEHNELVREGWRFFQSRRPESYSPLLDKKLVR